jgi:hypothetical protein
MIHQLPRFKEHFHSSDITEARSSGTSVGETHRKKHKKISPARRSLFYELGKSRDGLLQIFPHSWQHSCQEPSLPA